jgi:tetratricopeptide (TPR) repeat protein
LQVKIEDNDYFELADTYFQLGNLAQKQQEWEQAEQYYQQALQIYIECDDRYAQADTYHNLGILYASTLNLRNHHPGHCFLPDVRQQKAIPIPQLFTGSI